MASNSISDFLDRVVPEELRQASTRYSFVVIGTRAVNAYLEEASLIPVHTNDWDIMLIGGKTAQDEFAGDIVASLSDKGYNISIEYHAPIGNSMSIFDFKSRSWVRLAVSINGSNHVTFLDVYRIDKHTSGMGVYLTKNGLLYSDLGFLVRELDRDERNAKLMIAEASRMNEQDTLKRIELVAELLEDNTIDITIMEDTTETLHKAEEQDIKELLIAQKESLEHAKKTLIRVARERDVLFGLVLSGKANKMVVSQICKLCRSMESNYERYNQIKRKCAEEFGIG